MIITLDPIVDEIRHIRGEYARKLNFDLDAICRDLREKQSIGNQRGARSATETLAGTEARWTLW